MYNEDIKKEFLDTISDKKKKQLFINLFQVFEQLEVKEGIDLFCMPRDIIAKTIMDNFKVNSLSSLKGRVSEVNRYQKWANKKGYIPDEYKSTPYERKLLKHIFLKYNKINIYRTPKEFYNMVSKHFPQSHVLGITTDQLCSTYLILLYQGFTEEEIFTLKTSNIKIEKSGILIKTNDKMAIVYDEFYDLIHLLATKRLYMCESTRAYGTRPMDDRFIDNGGGWSDKSLKTKIKYWTRESLKDLNFRMEDIYLMGMIFKRKYLTGGLFKSKDLLIECYGENATQPQRENLYNLLELWETKE